MSMYKLEYSFANACHVVSPIYIYIYSKIQLINKKYNMTIDISCQIVSID